MEGTGESGWFSPAWTGGDAFVSGGVNEIISDASPENVEISDEEGADTNGVPQLKNGQSQELEPPSPVATTRSDNEKDSTHQEDKQLVGGSFRNISVNTHSYTSPKTVHIPISSSTDTHQRQVAMEPESDVTPAGPELHHDTQNEKTVRRILAERQDIVENLLNPRINHRSVKQFTPPRPSFKKTQAFFEALNFVTIDGSIHCTNQKVLHIYGMSGSGKSQIVHAICNQLESYGDWWVIWHIQCQDSSMMLSKELGKLCTELEKQKLVSPMQKTNALSELKDNRTMKIVELLIQLKQNVLLALEDVPMCEREIARNLIQMVGGKTDATIQILIASQKKDSLFTEEDIDSMSYYTSKKISGFTKEEAMEFLAPSGHQNKFANHLAEALAYSPLRLTLSKSYCTRYGISYQEYFESLGKDKAVIEKEKEFLQEFPELAKCHGYEVILKALRPKGTVGCELPEVDDEEGRIQFSVMKMICFLGNDDIPDYLIGRCFQEIKNFDSAVEKRMVRYLLTKLEQSCDASVSNERQENLFVSLHRDILLAIGIHMDENEKQEMFIKVLHAMAMLVKKDNRFRSDNTLVFNLINHMESIIHHQQKILNGKTGGKKADKNKFDISLGLSRIYEVLGFGITQHQQTEDQYLGMAIKYIWDLVCTYSKKPLSKKAKSDLLVHEKGKDPKEVAKTAYAHIKKANMKIPDEFFVDNWKSTFPVTELYIKDMRERLGEGCGIDWKCIEARLKQGKMLTDNQISLLQEHKMILDQKKLKSVYLCERIASILHSRGRQVLYLSDSISVEEQEKYEWFTEVGLLLCQEMLKDTGIHSLFEYIIQANNKLQRMLKNRRDESDEAFSKRIGTAREYGRQLCNVSCDFYEHGMFKIVSGTDYTILNALRYIVKANTKIYKRQHLAPSTPRATDIEDCDRMFYLAKKNVKNFVVCSNSMVQAGKYYAAIGNYDKAMEAFLSGFDVDGKGIEHQQKKYPNANAWALHNIGMTLCASHGNCKDFQNHRQMFMTKFQNAVNITQIWRNKLEEIKRKVEEIEILRPTEQPEISRK